ncbi:Putative acetyltransferase EpsM [Paenibacillus allorhizoplanae]|uniref:Acetyltransferase EpsM n=1 Tax=Paenibacillus allorhizoplanae TaxID=2905648 RepID=A0ABM9CLD5_9BACL|nr:acetyltransferase [Paenibacillus allorhizoplanae]CAH1215791.1 Putative acetyltransferase EpsM [Paenibacillus allorhizoplanae]
MNLPIIIIGGGGHAKVLIESLLLDSKQILGYTELDPLSGRDTILGIPFLGTDDYILQRDPESILLVNGIGSIKTLCVRKQIYLKYKEMGFTFTNVIHPSSIISPNARLGEGIQVMAGAIVQVGSSIGDNSIINTKASVDHDCLIGKHVHIAPGVIISGEVVVDEGSHIGSGSTIIQQVHIHPNSTIGAGSVVLKDVQANRTAYGVPAKEVDK